MNRQMLRCAFVALYVISSTNWLTETLRAQSPGTVRAWGFGGSGQLGNGSNGNSDAAVIVSNLTNVVSVAAGEDHSMALKADGTVWTWGANGYGQLGNGTTISANTPVQVSGLGSVIAVTAGDFHSIALKSDGTVWAWGRNCCGELGNGTTTKSSLPVLVSALPRVVAIAAGGSHSLAVESYHCGVIDPGLQRSQNTPGIPGLPTCSRIWAWGANGYGEFGNGTTTSSLTPVSGPSFSGDIRIATGVGHSIALKSDGTIWQWGAFLNVPEWTVFPISTTPVQVFDPNPSPAVGIAEGAMHSLALKADGTVSTWGENCWGELGNGTYFNDSYTPVTSWLIPPGAAVAGGLWYSAALKADGTAYRWGAYYTRGYGYPPPYCNFDVDTQPPYPIGVANVSGAVRIAAGALHTLVVVNPLVSVNPASLNFGSITIGSASTTKNVTMTNQGPDPLTVISLSMGGTDPGDFIVSGPTLPVTVPAGAAVVIDVKFVPTAAGTRAGTLLIGDNGFNSPHSVALSGTGVNSADVSVTQSVSQSGRRLTYTLVVRNSGPGSASNVSLSDAIPPKTQFVSVSGPGCGPIDAKTKVVCSMGELASGAEGTAILAVDVTSNGATDISNTAQVASSTTDPNTGNNSSTLMVRWKPGK